MRNQLIPFGATQTSEFEAWKRYTDGRNNDFLYLVEGAAAIQADDFEAAFGEVRGAVQRGQGLVVAIRSVGQARQVIAHKNGKRGLPGRALAIDLNGQTRWLPLSGESRDELKNNESVIVPVTPGMEKKLEEFVQAVDDLPEDLRCSMLYNLVQPAFDSRLARLEALEPGRTSAATAATDPRSGRGDDAITIASVIAVAALLLGGLGWYLLYSQTSDIAERIIALQPAADRREEPDDASRDRTRANGRDRAESTSTERAGAESAHADLRTILDPVEGQPEWLELTGVTFTGGANPVLDRTRAIDQLRNVAKMLSNAGSRVEFEIGAFTDSSGSASSNLDVSQRRAEAVKDVLTEVGAPSDQITARGYGASQFIDVENTTAARNRRIAIRVLKR
jgi:outer membrane protein OmpA-like peptidoglycan-associated protein